jgi:hypothetical protein
MSLQVCLLRRNTGAFQGCGMQPFASEGVRLNGRELRLFGEAVLIRTRVSAHRQ